MLHPPVYHGYVTSTRKPSDKKYYPLEHRSYTTLDDITSTPARPRMSAHQQRAKQTMASNQPQPLTMSGSQQVSLRPETESERSGELVQGWKGGETTCTLRFNGGTLVFEKPMTVHTVVLNPTCVIRTSWMSL